MSGAAFLRVKKLTGAGIIKAAAKHNRRAIAAEMGAATHIDASRCYLNVRMEGPEAPQGVADLAQSLMQGAGVVRLRKDAVRAVEAVFSLPAGTTSIEPPVYFARCVEWARATFGPVLSADAHHDEAAPHVHVLCLPLVNGRMVGSDLVGGPSKLRAMQTTFHAEVAQTFGLKRGAARLSANGRVGCAAAIVTRLNATADPVLKSVLWPAIRDCIDRDPRRFAETLGFDSGANEPKPKGPARSFVNVMTGRGKGAKTHEEQQRRDVRLTLIKPIGFGAPAATVDTANPRTL